MMSPLYERFATVAEEHHDRTAIVSSTTSFSYAELKLLTDQMAAGLEQAGLGPATLLAVDGVNRVEYVALYLAAARTGCCVVPIDERLSPPEIDAILDECNPAVLAIIDRSGPLAGRARERTDSATPTMEVAGIRLLVRHRRPSPHLRSGDLVIQHSSGSTGRTKGIILSSSNIYHKVMNWNETLEISHTDVFLCSLTLSHCYGMYVHTLAGLLAGATVHLPALAGLTPRKIAELLQTLGVTVFGTLPYTYQMLAQLPPAQLRWDKLRYAISGSAPLPESTARAMRERSGRTINQVYGLTEIGLICFNKTGTEVMSIGPATRNMRTRVLNPEGEECPVGTAGELVVQCESMARGYFDNPAEDEVMFKDGWLHTKDIVRMTAAGEFLVCGRISQFVNVGGNKVAPSEIEAALLEHEAIADVAVIGKRHDSVTETVVAFLVLKAEARQPTGEELIKHCSNRLSAFKLPREFHFVDSLPRSPLGKVLKSQLVA
jgi:acyl-CoA synthetase (AMP-forming)/AMP-acid ligase II